MTCRPPDIREQIFREHMDRIISAVITAQAAGVLSGLEQARGLAQSMQLSFSSALSDGDALFPGSELARVTGNPLQVVEAEDFLLGAMSKTSGIATAARMAKDKAGSRFQVVSGGFKKMPHEIKSIVRKAIKDGGVEMRIAPRPFVYLDKNYVRILGGIKPALEAAALLEGSVVIQVRGETAAIEQEATAAARGGAWLIMVDTGSLADLAEVSRSLRRSGLRSRVQVGFAGEIDLDKLDSLAGADLDAVDIGYAIVDAPCLPMRFDVVSR